MTRREILKLVPGDEVFWTDPDEGLCSDVWEILEIYIEDEGDTVLIKDPYGRELECYRWELS